MDKKELRRAMDALHWEAAYRKRARGADTGRCLLAESDSLDEDFARALREAGVQGGKLLDLGAGTGWQAIHFARLGFDVTATDVSPTCVAEAVRNCAASQVNVRVLQDDILRTSLTEDFDVIIDRGCFTVVAQDLLKEYATQVARLIRPTGLFLLKLDRKYESKLSPLLRAFVCCSKVESSYLGPGNRALKALFCQLRLIPSPS